MPAMGRLRAAAFSRAGEDLPVEMREVPVDVSALLDDHVGKAVDFLERDAAFRQRAEHDATAFGPEIDGEIMMGAHGRQGGDCWSEAYSIYMTEVNHLRFRGVRARQSISANVASATRRAKMVKMIFLIQKVTLIITT